MRNGDLFPNAAGVITKQQTFDALMHVGISKKVATETTDANFDHLDDPKQLNVFRMNTVNNDGPGDPSGPIEHFRSTGIRDGGNNPQPNSTKNGLSLIKFSSSYGSLGSVRPGQKLNNSNKRWFVID